MARFADGFGRRWEVAITSEQAAVVKATLDIDLPLLLADDRRRLSALLDDEAGGAWPRVVEILCREQAKKCGISSGHFLVLLREPATAVGASAALCQALFDAYQPGQGLSVVHIPRYTAAMAQKIDRATPTHFDTTIPTPADPSIPRDDRERRK